MIAGYGEPYTGAQVKTPETAKGEPSLHSKVCGSHGGCGGKGTGQEGTCEGVTGIGRNAGMPCNRHSPGYDRRRAG